MGNRTLLSSEAKEECVRAAGDPFGHLPSPSVTTSQIKVGGKLQQPHMTVFGDRAFEGCNYLK